MALRSIPSRGNSNPALIASFPCWTFLAVQVVGANTLYLAETQQQLALTSDVTTDIDALQIDQTDKIVQLWWLGDLYAAGSQAAGVTFKAYIGIPGVITSSAGVGAGNQGWMIGPSGPLQ